MRTLGNPIGLGFTPDQQAFLQTLVDAIQQKQPSVTPPGTPLNFKVTAAPGANIVQFTRSDGDTYALYRHTTPSLNGATRIELGKANQYTDNVGAANITVWYWVLAKTGQQQSPIVGPIQSTTAALNATITPPVAVAGSKTPTISDLDGQVIPGSPSLNKYQEAL